MKKLFRAYFPLFFALGIIGVTTVAFFYYAEYLLARPILIYIILCADIILLHMYYQFSFIHPLQMLNREIALFIAGGKK